MRIFTEAMLVLVSTIRGAWPCGSRNMRLSKASSGSRSPSVSPTWASCFRRDPLSAGIPALMVAWVVLARGSPEMQISSPSWVIAASLIAGASVTQSSAWKSLRRDGGMLKPMQARGGLAASSVRTLRTRMPELWFSASSRVL